MDVVDVLWKQRPDAGGCSTCRSENGSKGAAAASIDDPGFGTGRSISERIRREGRDHGGRYIASAESRRSFKTDNILLRSTYEKGNAVLKKSKSGRHAMLSARGKAGRIRR